MTTRGKKLLLFKVAGVTSIAFLAAALAEFAWAYLRAPAIVARFESSIPQRITVDQLGKARVEWLLTVEDPNFYHHHGVDFRTPGAGYTTITQGVVKILFFRDFKPGFLRWRKVQQSIIALAFDARVSKQEQLSLFVNSVYLGTVHGRDVRGFSEASETYFKKPAGELTDQEFLSLVAMILAPNSYNVSTHPQENHQRVQRIQNLLAGRCRPAGHTDIEYSQCAP